MEILPNNSACLELTIAMPGFSSSSPSFPSSGESGGAATKELDINQAPSGPEEECMEEEEEDDDGPNGSGGGGGGRAPRKKLRLTKEQSHILEESFIQNLTLNPKEKEALAMELKLKPRQVEVWFQNRRARSKMKQMEMECEYLKRWFGTLTEQNRKLKKEVEELRAMKVVAPPQCRQQLPASTLTMCPRCQRVTTTTLLDQGPATGSATTAAAASAAKVPFLQPRQPSATCYN